MIWLSSLYFVHYYVLIRDYSVLPKPQNTPHNWSSYNICVGNEAGSMVETVEAVRWISFSALTEITTRLTAPTTSPVWGDGFKYSGGNQFVSVHREGSRFMISYVIRFRHKVTTNMWKFKLDINPARGYLKTPHWRWSVVRCIYLIMIRTWSV